MKINVHDFMKMKIANQKISMITCYDYSFAKIVATSNIDSILVGDSVAMVLYGHASTIPATVAMMADHVAAVVKGAPNKFIIGDMPFLSYRQGLLPAMQSAEKIMQAGAQALKLEGVTGHEAIIEHLVGSGIPVMGHLGLTPQSIHQLGGFTVQGIEAKAQQLLLAQAKKLEALGCFACVLECIPAQLAKTITSQLAIPTIGIGAGIAVSGQILVLQDLLGMNAAFNPKFLKVYCKGIRLIKNALNNYDAEVKNGKFPEKLHSY